MAEIDDDMLDRAIEAAEAKIEAQDTETPVSAEPTQETEVETPAVEEATKESKARDEKGRFLKGAKKAAASEEEPAPDNTDITEDQAVENVEEQEVQEPEAEVSDAAPIEPPVFWSAEDKAAFAKAPKDVQGAISRYEAQRNEWANRINSETAEARTVKKQLDDVFEPYKLKYQANGLKTPIEVTERLLAWNEVFEKDVKTGIVDLMRKNGLSPADLMNEDQGQFDQPDPQIAEALSQAQAARQAAEELKQQLEQQQQSTLKASIDQWKTGADSTGQPRKAFAEMYSFQIDQAAAVISKNNPTMPILDVLSSAYEYVLTEARKVHGVNGLPKPVAKQAVSVAKAKAAASGVTGGPSSGTNAPRPRARTLDEALDRAEERLGL